MWGGNFNILFKIVTGILLTILGTLKKILSKKNNGLKNNNYDNVIQSEFYSVMMF